MLSSDAEILEIVIDEGLGLTDGWEGMFSELRFVFGSFYLLWFLIAVREGK